jgi:hypothetical protein
VDERRHPATDQRWWGEAWSFEFATPGGELGGFVRLGLLPNRSTCWYWAWVVGPDRAPVVVLDHEVPLPRGASLELRADGLWADHIIEEPFEHVSVGAEAFALRLDDPAEALAGGSLLGEPTPFGLDLGWESVAAPAAITGRPGLEGYRIPCQVVGEVLVADERFELDAVGHRHHTWGVEDWWSAPWTTVDGVLDDGTWLSASATPPAPPTLDAHGLPTGDRLTSADGPDLDVVVDPLALAPVVAARSAGNGDGATSVLARALCRITDPASGRRGVGWAEWNLPRP